MKVNPVLYILIGVVVLIGLFIAFKPKETTSQPVTQTSSQPTATPISNIKTFELVVKDKKLVSGEETLKVNQGDEVTIKITSDISDEFHLHGYDKSIDLEKDTQAQLKFTADKTGRFEYELENSKIDLGALEVQPKM
jgi:heme/copper-type cytochrome/quinol oxidase subunit 2